MNLEWRRLRPWNMTLIPVLIAFAAGAAAQVAAPGARKSDQKTSSEEQTKHDVATTPVPRAEAWWTERHASQIKQLDEGHAELLFLGDSITQGWEDAGKDAWAKRYTRFHAVNLGISGDRTQHVLWRLDNGILSTLKGRSNQPKAVVLMIGTNNSNGDDHTAEEIAAGITAIVEKLKGGLPKTKILLLAIFPRGETPNPQREKNARANEIVSKLADQRQVYYLDIGEKFLDAKGVLSKEIMPDFLHLSAKGYEIWAGAIKDELAELTK